MLIKMTCDQNDALEMMRVENDELQKHNAALGERLTRLEKNDGGKGMLSNMPLNDTQRCK